MKSNAAKIAKITDGLVVTRWMKRITKAVIVTQYMKIHGIRVTSIFLPDLSNQQEVVNNAKAANNWLAEPKIGQILAQPFLSNK